jgi:hypothetical protein
MVFTFLIIALVIETIWLIAVSYLLWKSSNRHKIITRNGDTKSLHTILETLTREQLQMKKDIDELLNRCDTIEKNNLFHIQKIGLLRFNPFKDTGGDQSFILSLLDARDSGIVISGLYSRSGTRWYAKKVASGKGIDYELSAEELKAVQIAKPAHEK